MTPSARVAAAIDILDDILTGAPAEKALTTWARRSRFAGSKDRNAVRDHVFDTLRKRDFYQLLGGGSSGDLTGRSLMIGAMRHAGQDPAELFDGQGYGPAQLSETERTNGAAAAPVANLPDWLFDQLAAEVGDTQAMAQAEALSERAPITLRCNRTRVPRAQLIDLLEAEGFTCHPNLLAPDAITVTGAYRGLVQTDAFREGLFEMQDATSQAVVEHLPLDVGPRLLDFCAGGGGKTLALAARFARKVTAHDADVRRMAELPERARRAGAAVEIMPDVEQQGAAGFDLVLVDAPCSGSGSWRRAPDAKWRMTPERLSDLVLLQREILTTSQSLVAQGGVLAYVTCSILRTENADQVAWFLAAHPDWRLEADHSWPVSELGDGFFLAVLRKA